MREYLPQLDWDRLDKHRAIRIEQILEWADAHYAKHGKWPVSSLGGIPGTGQTWVSIDSCLRYGCRGLPGGNSWRGCLRNTVVSVPDKGRVYPMSRFWRGPTRTLPLRENGLLNHPDRSQVRGRLGVPSPLPWRGPVAGYDEGTHWRDCWRSGAVCGTTSAFRNWLSSGYLAWAEAHHKATGRWPACRSGPIAQSSAETWMAIEQALRKGSRGLPGGSSLAKLLRKQGLK